MPITSHAISIMIQINPIIAMSIDDSSYEAAKENLAGAGERRESILENFNQPDARTRDVTNG